MSVKEYVSSEGINFFRVNVDIRSKVDPAIRIQKQKEFIETLSEAKKAERLLLREAERDIAKREAADATWEEVIEAFDRSMKAQIKDGIASIGADTQEDYVSALYKWTGDWMKRPAGSISTPDVRQVLATLKANGKSQCHQSKLKSVMNKVFTFGIENRLIRGMDRIPTFGISINRKGERVPDILTAPQLQRLLQLAKVHEPRWYFIWAVAIYTGMRNGELMALLWTDIDWTNKLIHVTKSYNSRKKIVKSTKSGYWRDIPISSELELLLKELTFQTRETFYVLPQPWEWRQGQQAMELRKFCLQVGLPSIRFHALRACFATQLLKNGIAPVTVMKICGWKDLKTMQHYVRLSGIEIDGATEVLKFMSDVEVMDEAGRAFDPANASPDSSLTEAARA